MKLSVFLPGPASRGPAGRTVVLFDVERPTLNTTVTSARRARLVAVYPYPADFRRALRAVLGAPS